MLVTYSDEGQGHTGYLYRISGWTPTSRRRVRTVTVGGARVSRYANGTTRVPDGAELGHTWIQRWEHWATPDPAAMFAAVWHPVPVPGKRWRSGAQAHTYRRRAS